MSAWSTPPVAVRPKKVRPTFSWQKRSKQHKPSSMEVTVNTALVVVGCVLLFQLSTGLVQWHAEWVVRDQILQTLNVIRLHQVRHSRSRMAVAADLDALAIELPPGVSANVVTLTVDHKPSYVAEACYSGRCLSMLGGRAPTEPVRFKPQAAEPRIASLQAPAPTRLYDVGTPPPAATREGDGPLTAVTCAALRTAAGEGVDLALGDLLQVFGEVAAHAPDDQSGEEGYPDPSDGKGDDEDDAAASGEGDDEHTSVEVGHGR